MKRNRLFTILLSAAAGLLVLLPLAGNAQVAIDETNFPDSVFRAYVRANFDTDANDSLSLAEREAVTHIDVSGESGSPNSLSDLSGIEHFPNLDTLSCDYTGLSSLDVSQNSVLRTLDCRETNLTSLDVSRNPTLEYLDCSFTGLTSLDVRQNPALKYLYCSGTSLTSLDVSRNPALKTLFCVSTGITSLDVSQNPALEWLNGAYSSLTSLDLSQNPALEILRCENTGITSLDLSQNPALIALVCDDTELTSLDVSRNPALKSLHCENTGITSLNVNQNPALEDLYCSSTKITSLDVSRNPALIELFCHNTELTSLDVSQNPALEWLRCYNTGLMSLDVSGNQVLEQLYVSQSKLSHIDLSQNPALLTAQLQLQGNVHPVNAEVGGTYDLSRIPGFDLSRVTWEPGTEIEGSLLRFTAETIRYEYDTRLGGEENKVVFALQAVPGLGNEPGLPENAAAAPQPFRAYAEGGILHVENAQGLIEVFNLQGRRIYAGPEIRIPLPAQGVYIVRNQGRSLKVASL